MKPLLLVFVALIINTIVFAQKQVAAIPYFSTDYHFFNGGILIQGNSALDFRTGYNTMTKPDSGVWGTLNGSPAWSEFKDGKFKGFSLPDAQQVILWTANSSWTAVQWIDTDTDPHLSVFKSTGEFKWEEPLQQAVKQILVKGDTLLRLTDEGLTLIDIPNQGYYISRWKNEEGMASMAVRGENVGSIVSLKDQNFDEILFVEEAPNWWNVQTVNPEGWFDALNWAWTDTGIVVFGRRNQNSQASTVNMVVIKDGSFNEYTLPLPVEGDLIFKNDNYLVEKTTDSLLIFEIENPNGIAPNIHEITIAIYPNPAVGNIVLDVVLPERECAVISVLNMTGKEVKLIDNSEIQSAHYNVNLADMSSGIYFIKIVLRDKVFTQKLIFNRQ